VNKMMNFIVWWYVDSPESASKRHRRRRPDFIWLGKEGISTTGTNGRQLWDIVFIAQAIVESGLATEVPNRASCVKAGVIGSGADKRQHRALWKGLPTSEQGSLALQYPSAELHRQRPYCRGPEGGIVPPGTPRMRTAAHIHCARNSDATFTQS
jgi:hypothetical protein